MTEEEEEELAGCNPKGSFGVLSPYDSLIILYGLDSLGISEAVLFNQQKMLAQRILSQADSFTTDVLAQSFLADIDTTFIPDFLAIENGITFLAGMDSLTLLQVKPWQLKEDSIWTELALLDSLLLTYTPGSWPDSLLDRKEAWIDHLDSINWKANSIIQEWDSLANLDLENLLSFVQALTPQTIFDSTNCIVYDILLKLMISNSAMTQGMVDTLEEIASSCYDEFGGGVLLARNWLPDSLATIYTREDMPDCQQSSRRSNRLGTVSNPVNDDLHIWPQPANGTLNFSVRSGRVYTEVDLLDLTGTTIAHRLGQPNHLHLPTGLNGMFVLKVTLTSGEVLVQKVILHD